jgi:hypothetical protein
MKTERIRLGWTFVWLRGVGLLLALFCTSGALLPQLKVARANGVPVRVALTYLPGLSNFGPEDAHGSAELSYAEGLIHVDAEGLPVLQAGDYGLWLVNTATNRALAAGTFSADAGGSTTYQGKLKGVTSYDYDLIVVTVEAGSGAPATPSDRRSIGGYFQAIQKPPAAGTGGLDTQPNATGSPGVGPNAVGTPATLPNTGDVVPAPSQSWRGKAAVGLFALGGLSFWAALRGKRRRT